jgi:hypothetical protein
VERPVRCVRANFVYGRAFIGDADLDTQRLTWLEEVANRRVHRTIRAVPRERFEAEERQHLLALAERAYRPLVLPEERTRRRTLLQLVPGMGPGTVEQRGLAAYQALVDGAIDRPVDGAIDRRPIEEVA